MQKTGNFSYYIYHILFIFRKFLPCPVLALHLSCHIQRTLSIMGIPPPWSGTFSRKPSCTCGTAPDMQMFLREQKGRVTHDDRNFFHIATHEVDTSWRIEFSIRDNQHVYRNRSRHRSRRNRANSQDETDVIIPYNVRYNCRECYLRFCQWRTSSKRTVYGIYRSVYNCACVFRLSTFYARPSKHCPTPLASRS